MKISQIFEKLDKSDDMGDWIKDFYKSDAPQFKGKSKKKRRQMAIAAKLSAMDEEIQKFTEGENAEIWDTHDFDPNNIEVLVKGVGRYTLAQLQNRIKTRLENFADSMDYNSEGVEKILSGDSFDAFMNMLKGYNEVKAELETPQMKRKRTIYKKKNPSLEALARHVKEGVPLPDSLFRYQSEAYFDTFKQAKQLREAGALPELDWESEEMLGTDIGESVELKGVGRVWLDVPYLDESDDYEMTTCDYCHGNEWDPDGPQDDDNYDDCPKCSGTGEIPKSDLDEAEYNGKKVQLNKPKRGGSKKYYVYVKNPKTGRVKKISFGDPGLKTKSGNKKRASNFAARHNCEKKNDKTKAGYWACRLPRYGLVKGGKWW